MKALAIALACLLLPALAIGQCGGGVEVHASGPPTFQLSSSTARLTVSRDGEPLAVAKVDIYEYGAEKHPLISVTTSDNGVVILPKLTPGHFYHLVAGGVPGMRGDLLIQIAEDATDGAVTLSMKVPPPPRELVAAEAMAPSRVKDFAGVVQDSTGAGVAGAFVEVWRKGTTGGAPLEEIKTDSTGRFSAHFQSGVYIASFSATGFRARAGVFEIADGAEAKYSQVILQVLMCS